MLSFGKAGDKKNPYYFANCYAGNSGLPLIRFSPNFNGPCELAPEYQINLIEACESLVIDADPPKSVINEHSVTPNKPHALIKFKLRPGKFALLESNCLTGQTAAACAILANMTEAELLLPNIGPQIAAWFETVWNHRYANCLGRPESFWYYVEQFANHADERATTTILLEHIREDRLLECPVHLQNLNDELQPYNLLLPKAHSSLEQCVLLETFARARERRIVLGNLSERDTSTAHDVTRSVDASYSDRLFKQEVEAIHAVLEFTPPTDYSPSSSFNIAQFMVGRMPMAPSDADAFVVSLFDLAENGIIAASRFLSVDDPALKTPVDLPFDEVMKVVEHLLASSLDTSQQHFANLVLKESLGGLVAASGPPGTGKSAAVALTTLCAASMGMQCLLLAPTDVAADSLCFAVEAMCPTVATTFRDLTGSDKFDLQMCRIHPAGFDEDCLVDAESMTSHEFAMHRQEIMALTEYRAEGSQHCKRCEHLSMPSTIHRKAVAEQPDPVCQAWLAAREAALSADNREDGRRLVQDFKDINRAVCDIVKDESPILVTTVSHALSLKTSAEVVFVDEASQLTQGQFIAIATANPRVRVFVVIGDTQQLPPPRATYLRNELESVLSKSMLEKLVVKDVAGRFCTEFSVNYKSHFDIVNNFNHYMYGNRIRSAYRGSHPIAAQFKYLATSGRFRGNFRQVYRRLKEHDPRWFRVDVPGGHQQEENHSRFNVNGQEVILEMIVQMLYSDKAEGGTPSSIKPSDICIVTMYAADKRRLMKLIDQRGRELKKPELNSSDIRVITVDASQGISCNVAFVHMVSGGNSVGFIDDAKRFNVAVSRAREMFFLVGDFTWMLQNWSRNKKAVKLGNWLEDPKMRARTVQYRL